MAQNRPTFHEAWYRISALKPRLLSSVNVFRQEYRGQLWHVIENAANNQYSRLSADAYAFVGLLNGQRTVSKAWDICNEKNGDQAPTQGEVIQILGQLYSSNLLYVDLPPDSAALFERYKKRTNRQVQSYFMNLLYIRIPLLDPDWMLNAWVKVFGLFFTSFGMVLWLALVGTGLYYVFSDFSELMAQSQDVLAPGNLLYLYLTLISIKIIHEFSHAFACKKFGKLNKNGGQVHTMGVMFLVFFPLPYVDASSAWAFASKWHRAVVGLAGILAELALAAIAAVVWAKTSTGTVHIVAYNVIFVASVSTLLFNGNALLRFDAYYVLSDLIEIPNLGNRSKAYLYYLVKRYSWGLKHTTNPAYTVGERLWFFFYGIASTLYRIFICVRILLYLNDRLPKQFSLIVPIFAFSAVVTWVCVPIGKYLKYLFTSQELHRQRPRALISFTLCLGGIIYGLGLLKVPDYCRLEGIVEPNNLTTVYTRENGFVSSFSLSGSSVAPDELPLITTENQGLKTQQQSLSAQRRRLEVLRRMAELNEAAATQILDEQIKALNEQIERVNEQIAALTIRTPLQGTWFSPNIHASDATFLERGMPVGQVGQFEHLVVVGTTPQTMAAQLTQADKAVEFRIKGYPNLCLKGVIQKIAPAGQSSLPAAALAYTAGGSTAVKQTDQGRIQTAERIFEVRIGLNPDQAIRIMPGQRVLARIRLGSSPLLKQWYQSARQLFQRRFYI
jgi:putative peptide zinc metalloprotease protein